MGYGTYSFPVVHIEGKIGNIIIENSRGAEAGATYTKGWRGEGKGELAPSRFDIRCMMSHGKYGSNFGYRVSGMFQGLKIGFRKY
jgi:hypothetical protein